MDSTNKTMGIKSAEEELEDLIRKSGIEEESAGNQKSAPLLSRHKADQSSQIKADKKVDEIDALLMEADRLGIKSAEEELEDLIRKSGIEEESAGNQKSAPLLSRHKADQLVGDSRGASKSGPRA